MFGIPFVDLAVIIGYSVLMVVIGLFSMSRVKNQEDFFLGGRRFGKALQIFSSFGQSTSPENVVGTVTTTYRDGAGGIWSQLALLWATPTYWLTSPWYRRMRVLTLGDFYRERFQSRGMAMLYSSVASFFLVIMIGLGLKALSVTVLGITLKPAAELTAIELSEHSQALRLESLARQSTQAPLSATEAEELASLRLQKPRREFSYLSEKWLVWSIVAVVGLYATAGGLRAAVWTKTVQGSMTLVLSVMLIPFAIKRLNELHGVSGLVSAGEVIHRELPGYFFAVLGSAQNADFTWYFIVALCVMSSINVAVQSNQLTSNASARDESAARIGFTTGTLIKRYCTISWGLVGLLCFAIYGREIQNSDLVWGHATRDLLGGLNLGLVGLMIACLLAALQSVASTLMISSSGLFTKNVYQPLRPGRSEAHYVFVGRLAGGVILIAAAMLSTGFDTILEMMKFLWEFNAVVAAAFWCGVKWRGATRRGAWASIGTATILFIVLPVTLPVVIPGMRTNEALMRRTKERVTHQDYAASRRDVAERRQQIANWSGPGAAPAPLQLGEKISRPIFVSAKAIYWGQGIEQVDGVTRGRGIFNVEMFVLDRFFDLSANPYALNETIRYTYKILLPFLVLIVVSWLTRGPEPEAVTRFFLRMRTKVRADRDEDARAVEAAYADPESTRAVLLFPRTRLEFFKWDREDAVGFFAACVAAFGVLAVLGFILSVGA